MEKFPKKQRNKIKTDKVQPAHEKLSKVYEIKSMSHSTAALRSPKRGMRGLRSRKHSIDFANTEDTQRLKRFLKIARVSALGAIVIDTALAGQKVQNARDVGENAEKVAYEEQRYRGQLSDYNVRQRHLYANDTIRERTPYLANIVALLTVR